MKKFIGILLLGLALLTCYSIFFHKKSKRVAGELRYYTTYEKYKAQDKVLDYGASAFKNDKYNLTQIKQKIEDRVDLLNENQLQFNLIIDSINSFEYSLSDLERSIDHLNYLREVFKRHLNIIDRHKEDLKELEDYIAEFESGLVSIEKYREDILKTTLFLNFIDSASDEYLSAAKSVELEVIAEKQAFSKRIEKQREKERLEFLAQIKRNKELKEQRESFKKPMKNDYNSASNLDDYFDLYNGHFSVSPPINSNSSRSKYISKDYPIYSSPNTNSNHVRVKGYYKSNGTYVKPYVRTAPNSTIRDNFSTKPNVNPYTGEKGTVIFDY